MISVLIPTYGRPERVRQAITSILNTADFPGRVEILVRVAAEDALAPDYMDNYARGVYRSAKVVKLAGCANYGGGIEELQRLALGGILFAGSDDVLFCTHGWDVMVEDAFAVIGDGLMVAYANNGMSREKCEHFFTTRRWVNTVGYMVWREFRHFCVDQWVEELATGIGRLRFLRSVVVEHMHRKYRKAPNDATYEMVRGATRTSELDNVLYRARAAERAEALARLRAALS